MRPYLLCPRCLRAAAGSNDRCARCGVRMRPDPVLAWRDLEELRDDDPVRRAWEIVKRRHDWGPLRSATGMVAEQL